MSDTLLSQRTLPWANTLLPNTNLYFHAVGCFVTCIAMIVGVTPDVAIEKLNAVGGFNENGEVIWDKISEAFPGWTAQMFSPYDNDAVLKNLSESNRVIVEVSAAPIGGMGLHAVVYIGNSQCEDPWDGTVKPTITYPTVYSYVVLTKTEAAATDTPPVDPASNTPVPGENVNALPAGWPATYQGLDMTNLESIKTAIDVWKKDADGELVSASQYADLVTKVTGALGIDGSTPIDSIISNITTLKSDFAKQVQAGLTPAPAQIEGQGPTIGATVAPATLKTVPQNEKESLMNRFTAFEQEVKTLLGILPPQA